MNDLTLHGSPFDAIRRTRADGSEYWSARDLMPLMGYARWNEFKNPIERAITSAENVGHEAADLFRRSTEKATGGRPSDDFELTRFAAYLVAMNGDPNKSEVAAAQGYFAIRTHQAETAAPNVAALSARDVLAIAQRLVDQEERTQIAEARAAESERVVDAIEAAEGLTPTEFHKHYFSDVTARAFFEHLYRLRLLIDQRGSRGRDDKGRVKNGHAHAHPAAAGKPYFYLHGRIDRDGVRRESTRVRPGRPEVDLVAFLTGKGLPANANALTTTPASKEIAA